MEAAPYQNLLISIPSQAADAIAHLLQDQMSDPEQMTQNLKRLGSVVEWGLGQNNFKIGAGGDTDGIMSRMHERRRDTQIPLLMLPQEIRNSIWSRLDNSDILALRSVSRQMRIEIDHEYGIPIILDTSNDSVKLMQNVVVRSCFVTRMQNLAYFNFLPRPFEMKHIRFQHDIVLTAEALDYILRKFPNLQTISFFNKNLLYEYRGKEMQLVTPTDTKLLLKMISQKDEVFGVSLKYNSVTSAVEWKLELDSVLKTFKVGYVHLEISSEAIQVQNDAFAYLEEQKDLYEIRSELVGLTCSSYKNIIQQNTRTLTSLHLLSLKCAAISDPFDCKYLKKCENLRFLSLSGENSFSNADIGGFPFISVIDVNVLASLRKLCACSMSFVHLTENDLLELKRNTKIWTRLSNSMVDQVEILEMKLGITSSEDGEITDKDYEYIEDIDAISSHDHDSDLRTFISDATDGFHPALIKGLLITTWITLC